MGAWGLQVALVSSLRGLDLSGMQVCTVAAEMLCFFKKSLKRELVAPFRGLAALGL